MYYLFDTNTRKLQHEFTCNRMIDKIKRVVKMAKHQSQPKSRISSDRHLYSKDVELSRFQVFFVPDSFSKLPRFLYAIMNS